MERILKDKLIRVVAAGLSALMFASLASCGKNGGNNEENNTDSGANTADTQKTENPDILSVDGCDFVLQLGKERKGTEVRILQLTDTQIIDPSQRREPDRLVESSVEMWDISNVDALCFDCIRDVITRSNPDLIILTGDIVYGEFDDKGTSFEMICTLMDSFGIPWAPVFGNHDNETKLGVKWQCDRFKQCEHCLFERGSVSGNGNYTIGIAAGDELLKVIYMIDSNGCDETTDPDVIKEIVIRDDQTKLIRERADKIEKAIGHKVSGFAAFHIATEDFVIAETSKKYCMTKAGTYELDVNRKSKDGDFGFKKESTQIIPKNKDGGFLDTAKYAGIDGVFVGHDHCIATSISYEGIQWVHGLKTGEYDSFVDGKTGGTLITLNGDTFKVEFVYHK